MVRVVGRDNPAVTAGPHAAAASKNKRRTAPPRTERAEGDRPFGVTATLCAFGSCYSSTKNGHPGGPNVAFPFFTILIFFIIVSYDALAASCASEMSADSKLRL